MVRALRPAFVRVIAINVPVDLIAETSRMTRLSAVADVS
jgi:hypothetical protein